MAKKWSTIWHKKDGPKPIPSVGSCQCRRSNGALYYDGSAVIDGVFVEAANRPSVEAARIKASPCNCGK